MIDRQTLIVSLYKVGAIIFGHFKLKSGIESPVYLNLRKIISHPNILRNVAQAMWSAVQTQHFDVICGVPYTALPIAACISLQHNIPLILCRKEIKDYGSMQKVEGDFTPGQRCLLVEDVISSGQSILGCAHDLEQAGLNVQHLVALINREQSEEAILTQKYKLHTVFTLAEVLQTLHQSNLLSPEELIIADSYMAEITVK